VAVTVTKVSRVKNQPQRFGQLNAVLADIKFDSSYPTGGEELTESSFGFRVIYGLDFLGMTDGAGDGTVTSIVANLETEATPKLICYDGGSEVTNTTDLSGITARFLVLGI
jgi:hypothetical protein